MQGSSFFSGLLKGFGGGLITTQQEQQQQEAENQKQLLDFYLKGMETRMLNPEIAIPLVAGLLTDPMERSGIFGKRKTTGGTAKALQALNDPESFGDLLLGMQSVFGGFDETSAGTLVPEATQAPSVSAPAPQTPTTTSAPAGALVPQTLAVSPGLIGSTAAPPQPFSRSYRNLFAPVTTNEVTYGQRTDGTPKGPGFFGALRRPDGSGVSSEISIGVDFGQGETQIPTLVPTLTAQEVQTLLTLPEGQPVPDAIADKAVAFARERLAAGKSPFAAPDEVRTDLLPEFPRASVIAAPRRQPTFADVPPPEPGAPPQPVFRSSVEAQTPQPAVAPMPPLVEPPPPPRRRPTLWNTPEQQQEQLNTIVEGQFSARELATHQGRVRAAAMVLRRDLATFRADQHREPTAPELQMLREQADAKVGLGGTGTAALPSYLEGPIIPDRNSPTGYSQQMINQKNPGDIRMVPAPSPMSTSTAQPNDLATVAFELFGKPGEDPRTLLTTPGRLTPQQVSEAQKELVNREVTKAQREAAVREAEQTKAEDEQLLLPDEAASMKLPYGIRRGQAALLGRMSLTPAQRQAVAEMFVLENELKVATELFEKTWPREANPIKRRADLAYNQSIQLEGFGVLQGLLKGMPTRLAVISGAYPISNVDTSAFALQLPKTAPETGNWGLVDVPTDYKTGKDLLARVAKMIDDTKTQSGVRTWEGTVPRPYRATTPAATPTAAPTGTTAPPTTAAPAAPPAGGTGAGSTADRYKFDGRGNLIDTSTGQIVSGPDRPRAR